MEQDLLRALGGVQGWLHLDEAAGLREAVRARPTRDDVVVVEIGSFNGRSTIALALGVRDLGYGKVIAIDPDLRSLPIRLKNLERAGVRDLVEVVSRTSHEARCLVPDGTVDVLFIDGSHRYEDVLQDIDDWTPALRDDAIAVCNDSSHPGVYRALRQRVVTTRSPFSAPVLIRSTLFVRFRRSSRSDRRWSNEMLRLRAVLWLQATLVGMMPAAPASIKKCAHVLGRVAVGRSNAASR